MNVSVSPTRLKKIIAIGFISFLLIFSTIYYITILNETHSKSNSSNDDDSDSIILSPLTLTPKGIRLTFIYNYNDSIVISWYTEKNATEPKLSYSMSADLSSATEITPNSTQLTSSTYIYYAELVNLSPNTTYHYQVRSDNITKREIMNFTTLANRDISNISFLVYGDSRTQRLERRTLVEKIMASFRNNFEFIVHTGDIVEIGTEQNEWNEYFDDTEALTAYKQGVYVEGNHEGGLSTKMYNNLLMYGTDTERYYYFNYGGVGFIILNSNDYTVGDDDQTNWLNQTLIQLSQENTFNFVFLHHPLLHTSRSSDYHQEHWKPLFDKYNVSLILCGHNHHYERSYPMINSSKLDDYDNSEQYNYTNLNDSIYIVTGGAGAPLYSVYNYDFIAEKEEAYHFILVDVKKEIAKMTISLESWGMPNDFGPLYLIDNITITKLT